VVVLWDLGGVDQSRHGSGEPDGARWPSAVATDPEATPERWGHGQIQGPDQRHLAPDL